MVQKGISAIKTNICPLPIELATRGPKFLKRLTFAILLILRSDRSVAQVFSSVPGLNIWHAKYVNCQLVCYQILDERPFEIPLRATWDTLAVYHPFISLFRDSFWVLLL